MKQQARHILAYIGINLWAQKDVRTQRIGEQIDRFKYKHQDNAITIDPVPAIPVTQTIKPNITRTDTPTTAEDGDDLDNITSKIPTQVNNNFHLQGVRIGSWILIVDIYAMDDEQIQLWHAMTHAMAKHAHEHNMPYHTHNVIYPLVSDDYAEHRMLNAAQEVFVGFMFALNVSDSVAEGLSNHTNGQTKSVFLTPIPLGITHHSDTHLPTLADMLANPTLKKTLWIAITA